MACPAAPGLQACAMTDDSLITRIALPEEYRLILADFPRADWDAHPEFPGLAAFWLDRHLSFRRVLDLLETDARDLIDRRLDPDAYGRRLVRLGSGLLNDLIGHHQIEDEAYFPLLAAREPRIGRGFAMLDADHHALHEMIDRFASGANAVLAQVEGDARREAGAQFQTEIARFARLLARHLDDEEDLVIPVVLKHRIR